MIDTDVPSNNEYSAENDGAPTEITEPSVKRIWVVDYDDPDLQEVGPDIGGGDMFDYNGKPFTGIIRHYNSGSLCTEISFLRGYVEGLWREYYPGGQVMEESYTRYNHDYGSYIRWDEKGNIIQEGNFGPPPVAKWLVAIDVYYRDAKAKAVGVLFNQFKEDECQIYVEYIDGVDEYIPGEFYKRELPCILKILNRVDMKKVGLIIVDGYVYIDNNKNYGLGGRLWEHLEGEIPVIGVAKTKFVQNTNTVREVYRGQSKKALYISTVGIDIVEATNIIADMKGDYRIPDVLKTLDQKTKSA